MEKLVGRIGLFIVAIIWGSGFVASALALDHYSPNQILALRFTLAFVVSVIVYYKELKNIDTKNLTKGIIIGVFLFSAFMFQTVGLKYTTASKNAFLTAVNIVIVPFLSYLILKVKLEKKLIVGSVITLIGIGFLSIDINSLSGINKGDVLTLICALFFALQIFYTDYYVKSVNPGVIMITQMGTAAMLSWIMVIFSYDFAFSFEMQAITPILYLGLISTLVAYGIQTWAQKRIESTESAMILSTEALFGMIASVIFLKEHITMGILVGGVLILFGILIVQIDRK